MQQEAKKALQLVKKHVDILIDGTRTDTFGDAVEAIRNDPEYQECVVSEFGFKPEVLYYIHDNGMYPADAVSEDATWNRK
jgi:hypothetical protein